MRGRAPASDSVTARTAAAQESPVEVPEGLAKLSKKERLAFDQYAAFRTGWTEAELRGLHRAVKIESNIARLGRQSRRVTQFIEKADGTFVTHPIFKEIRDDTKLLQSQLRIIGLNMTGEGRRKIANTPKPAAKQGISLVKK